MRAGGRVDGREREREGDGEEGEGRGGGGAGNKTRDHMGQFNICTVKWA